VNQPVKRVDNNVYDHEEKSIDQDGSRHQGEVSHTDCLIEERSHPGPGEHHLDHNTTAYQNAELQADNRQNRYHCIREKMRSDDLQRTQPFGNGSNNKLLLTSIYDGRAGYPCDDPQHVESDRRRWQDHITEDCPEILELNGEQCVN